MIGDNQVEIIRKMSSPQVLAALWRPAYRLERWHGGELRNALLFAFFPPGGGNIKHIRLDSLSI
jgi:hypothetical protein